MKKRGRPRLFDEKAVLARAMDVFWARGYDGIGVAELLRELKLGRQSFYDSFGSKRAIYLRVLEHYRSTQLVQVLELLKSPGSPLANVHAAVRFFENLARDKRQRGCLVANAMLEVGEDDEELRQFLEQTLALLEEAFHDALVRARDEGALSPAKKPRALARALTNASVGLAVTGRLKQGPAVIADIYSGTLAMLQ